MSGGGHPEGKPIRIAAVGDIHVHDKPAGAFRAFFSDVSKEADVLVLCGDLTATGAASEAENLAADVAECTIPVLGVLGNHDHQSGQVDDVRKILRASKFHLLEDEPFVYDNVGFAGVKGFCGGFNRYMLTSFGEDVIKRFVAEAVNESLKLENSLRALTTEKTVVALHYSPVTQTLQGEPPEIFPFLGSSRLAEAIDMFDVSAVFHGHAHHGTYEGHTNKGVPVYNTCLELVRSRNPDRPYVLLEL
jgi:Icc-related predicted phosphoesterase